ncbi:hypothetical protein TNCV_1140541 [Trichonephila clavipes]|nr:hypothetical protein TNCV_1140541 [Trichonephila clavipes]
MAYRHHYHSDSLKSLYLSELLVLPVIALICSTTINQTTTKAEGEVGKEPVHQRSIVWHSLTGGEGHGEMVFPLQCELDANHCTRQIKLPAPPMSSYILRSSGLTFD